MVLGIVLVGLVHWLRYRRIEFDGEFDAHIDASMRLLQWVCAGLVLAGLSVFMVAGFLVEDRSLLIPGLIVGLSFEVCGIGVGWNIPSVRSEFILRSSGDGVLTAEKLLKLVSLRRALLVNAPIALGVTAIFIAILVLFF
ncbi:MAG: hypothetical protein GC166_08595 [Alphaproteobacteria bacterium]|nr:hypothetical protein [Alphaproteobacteria bacterium]